MTLATIHIALLSGSPVLARDYYTEFQIGYAYTDWHAGEVLEGTAEKDPTIETIGTLESTAVLNNYSASFWSGDYNFIVKFVSDNLFDDEEFQKKLSTFIGLPFFKDTRWFLSGSRGRFKWEIENGPGIQKLTTNYKEIKTGILFEGPILMFSMGMSHFLLEKPGVKKLLAPWNVHTVSSPPSMISVAEISSWNVMFEMLTSSFYKNESGALLRFVLGIGNAEIEDSILGKEKLSSFSEEVVVGYKLMLLKNSFFDMGLILGGEFQGQMYGATKWEEEGNGHVDMQWSVFANLQMFF